MTWQGNSRGTAWEWYGNSMGMVWEQHGNSMVCVNRPLHNCKYKDCRKLQANCTAMWYTHNSHLNYKMVLTEHNLTVNTKLPTYFHQNLVHVSFISHAYDHVHPVLLDWSSQQCLVDSTNHAAPAITNLSQRTKLPSHHIYSIPPRPAVAHLASYSKAHPASYWMGRDVRMITYLHLVLRLRMSAAIPPLPLHTFMVCVENITIF
jgi:hypothetical protein